MTRSQSVASVLLSVLGAATLAACGAAKQYVLPVSAAKARDTFAPIAWCAQNKNLETAKFDDAIHVKVDENSWVYYQVTVNDTYDMVVWVDTDKVPQGQVNDKLTQGKAVGDAVWACADAQMKGTGATVNLTVSTGNGGGDTGNLSLCDRMFKCYLDISTNLCQGNPDANCKGQFEVKISGSPDDVACKAALDNVTSLVQPYKMIKADFAVPAACHL